MKRPEDEAHPDANLPGVIVCERGCGDDKDPYRLPARKTEKITIRYHPEPAGLTRKHTFRVTRISWAPTGIAVTEDPS